MDGGASRRSIGLYVYNRPKHGGCGLRVGIRRGVYIGKSVVKNLIAVHSRDCIVCAQVHPMI